MLNKHALVTGINGFCGKHLKNHLLQQGYTVSGIDLTSDTRDPNTTIYFGDIRDRNFVQKVITSVQPSHIFHLAGLIGHKAEFDILHDVNVRGTESLLDAVCSAKIDPIILITSSSAVYGSVTSSELPIKEAQPFRPPNAYAVSKIAQEMIAYSYYAQRNLRVIRTRAFNLIGPGQPPSLAGSAFAKQIAEIEAGQMEPILKVGNLTAQRDFVDVRDAVDAYQITAQNGRPGKVYNVCSGQKVSMQASLEQLLDLARASIKIEQDPTRLRPSDIPVSVGDSSLIHNQTNWKPNIPLKQSLNDLLNDWRLRIHKGQI